MPGEDMLGTSSALNYNGSRSAWGPLIDGDVIPEQPSAVGLKVPSILGSNANEGALFVLSSYGESASSLTQADYDTFLASNFGPLASRVNTTYPLKAFNGSVAAAMATIVTETSYHCPAHRGLARTADDEKSGSPAVPVWTYRFAHTPTCPGFRMIPAEILPVLGVTHTSEIPFVFNLTQSLPPPDGNCTFSEPEKGLAHAMSRAWTNMAEFGAPGDETEWPAWTPDQSMGVTFGDSMHATLVDYKTCAFWGRINEALNKYAATQEARG